MSDTRELEHIDRERQIPMVPRTFEGIANQNYSEEGKIHRIPLNKRPTSTSFFRHLQNNFYTGNSYGFISTLTTELYVKSKRRQVSRPVKIVHAVVSHNKDGKHEKGKKITCNTTTI